MARPITLCTGQWADLPLEKMCALAQEWGLDGLELNTWGHYDVERALKDDAYVQSVKDTLAKHKLKCWAIDLHLVGQAVCDPIDLRHKSILPPAVWGDGDPEGVRQRAQKWMIEAGRAAKKLGVSLVNGFTGSPVWHKLYFFPPTTKADIDAGYADFARRFTPILDEYQKLGLRFGLEVHPTEIAYDLYTTRRALDAVQNHPAFGINVDPSHFTHQFLAPDEFVLEFGDRIFHVHMKDSKVKLTGRNSILSSHLDFGDPRRGWDFVSVGHGDVPWGRFVRALNHVGYAGPLSIEWEDSGMDRIQGAKDSLEFVRRFNFAPSTAAFDAVFGKNY
jgi:sugar phosphate isomerase/epimerase